MNKNYQFYSPTKIYFGPQEEENVGEYIASYGYQKVLLVYGVSSCKKSGLYDRVLLSLKKKNIEYIELSSVSYNPTLEKVNEGLSLLREKPCDFILAIGGGSVIDCAKSIASSYFYDGNPFDFNEGKAKPVKALPIGVILTIAAAGSELSSSCVITDEKRKIKRGFNSDSVRPKFVIENPNLILGLPREQYAYGIVDILAHSMERYFALSAEKEFADYFALALMRAVVDAAKVLKTNLQDYAANKTLLLASSFSHNGITSVMKRFSMPVHQLEHELSGLYPNIAHGLGLAILYPYWMDEVSSSNPMKFIEFGKAVFNTNGNAKDAIDAYRAFLKEWNFPISLKEVGVKEDDVETMAQSFATRLVPEILPLDYLLAKRIYIRAWKGE